MRMRRTLFCALLVTAVVTSPSAQQRSIDDFFAAFTADWIRQNPNQAASTRFFTGEEQRQFERQITPLTPEWRRARVTLAERSLDELNRIAKASSLTDSQRARLASIWCSRASSPTTVTGSSGRSSDH